MTQFFNKSEGKEKRRQLRNNAPTAESVVWTRLSKKQVHGFKFRRQYGVGPYVIDSYCPGLTLAVEIDGDSHFVADANGNDERRQAFIESFGIRFLRFTNDQVYRELDNVLETISHTVLNLSA